MYKVEKTNYFNKWLNGIKDFRTKIKIVKLIDKMEDGNFGDVKPVGEGISESRIHYGPGYRVYFIQKGNKIIILLCGGDKSTQQKDIEKAKELKKCL